MHQQPAEPIEVAINFTELRRPCDIGIRRASVFLGLTANATAANPPISHVLDDKFQFRAVPNEITRETADHFAEEFLFWVLGNSLRDLVDCFSIFLVKCRAVIRMVETGIYDPDDLRAVTAKTESRSIRDQFDEISRWLSLGADYAEMFETFRRARNCLSHRRGVVARRDANGDGVLSIKWIHLGVFLQHPNGREQRIDNESVATGELRTGEGGALVIMKPVTTERSFYIGDQIRLTRHDMNDIFLGVHLATAHVLVSLNEFARGAGAPVANADEAINGMREATLGGVTTADLDWEGD